MGNQGSRTKVENIFNTHTDIGLEQRVDENCYNNNSNVNRVVLGNNATIDGGISQNIDSKFSCRMATTLDAIANAEITNDQFTKMKTKMSQTGVNLFQNQQNSQNASTKINNFTDINQLQEVIKNCNSYQSYVNETLAGDDLTLTGGIHQNISSSVDCIFNTDATLEGASTTTNTSTTDQDDDQSQEGVNPFFFLGSFTSSAIVVIIFVLFLFSSGGKKTGGGNKIISGGGNKMISGGRFNMASMASMASLAGKMMKR